MPRFIRNLLHLTKTRTSRRRPSFRPTVEKLEQRELLSVAPEEQLFVYQLNRARANPQAYEQEAQLPVSLAGVAARAPLAVNDHLMDSAGFKAEEMASNDYLSHQRPVTGIWPNQLARNFGYQLPSYFPDNDNYIESLASGWGVNSLPVTATPEAALRGLIIDQGLTPPGHRIHLLGMDDFNAKFKEV